MQQLLQHAYHHNQIYAGTNTLSQQLSQFPAPLTFMRHGVTAWNIADRYQGMTDTSLIEAGKEQALANASAVEALIRTRRLQKSKITIASSPLIRAHQSAEIIAQYLEIEPSKIQTQHGLREITMGRWEGLNNLKVKEVFYEERKSRKVDRWNFKPVDGESLSQRAHEVRQSLEALKPNTVVVTHAGILRIIHHLLGGEDCQKAAAANIPHEGLLHFDGSVLHQIYQSIDE